MLTYKTIALWLMTAVILLSGSNTPDKSSTHIIEIRQMKYVPEHLTVSPGDSVIWINRDLITHNAAEKNGRWQSTNLQKDDHFSIRIDSSVSFFCTFHPVMTGRIETSPQPGN